MEKSEWIWMPHPAHFCASENCFFRLATYVGGYIVSTVGEWRPYSEKTFMEIGLNRLFETMVFKAKESTCECCAFEIDVSEEVDFASYNDSKSAYLGHMTICEKWASLSKQGE